MTNSSLVGTVFALAISTSSIARADSGQLVESSERTHYTAEVDPVTFALKGHGILLSVRPAELPRWRFHASTFSFDMPDAFLGTANEGFHAEIRPSATAAVNYFWFTGRHRLRTGVALGYLRTMYTHDDAAGQSVDLRALAVSAQVGYQFFVRGTTGLFFELWVAAGASAYQNHDDVMLGGKTLDTPPVSVFPLFHIGYEI